MSGQMVHLEHTQIETHTVPDGTETYTDSEGNTQTRQRTTAVQVEMHYHNGTLRVDANSKKRMAAGFNPSIFYTDGHGIAVAPHTGKQHNITNSTTIKGETMGVNNAMEETARTRELFNDSGNKAIWTNRLAG